MEKKVTLPVPFHFLWAGSFSLGVTKGSRASTARAMASSKVSRISLCGRPRSDRRSRRSLGIQSYLQYGEDGDTIIL